MFKTRKQLKQQIERLEKEVAHHKLRTALVDTAGLPKCKSVACYNCKYCTFLYNPGSAALYLLGCGKNISCELFEATDKNKPPLKERLDEVARMCANEEYNLTILRKTPKSSPDDLVLMSPLPPCHQE